MRQQVGPVFVRGGFTVNFIINRCMVSAFTIDKISSLVFAGPCFPGDDDRGKGTAEFFNLVLCAGLVMGTVIVGKIQFLFPGAGKLPDRIDLTCFMALMEAGIEIIILFIPQVAVLQPDGQNSAMKGTLNMGTILL